MIASLATSQNLNFQNFQKKKKKNPVSSLAVEVSFFFLYLKKIITMVTCNRSKLTFTQNTSNWGWVDKFNTGEEMGCIRV